MVSTTLKEKLERGDSLCDISKWAVALYLHHESEFADGLDFFVQKLVSAEELSSKKALWTLAFELLS